MRCIDHDLPECVHSRCKSERQRAFHAGSLRRDDLDDPTSALHQAVYGARGAFDDVIARERT